MERMQARGSPKPSSIQNQMTKTSAHHSLRSVTSLTSQLTYSMLTPLRKGLSPEAYKLGSAKFRSSRRELPALRMAAGKKFMKTYLVRDRSPNYGSLAQVAETGSSEISNFVQTAAAPCFPANLLRPYLLITLQELRDILSSVPVPANISGKQVVARTALHAHVVICVIVLAPGARIAPNERKGPETTSGMKQD